MNIIYIKIQYFLHLRSKNYKNMSIKSYSLKDFQKQQEFTPICFA
jgi:hypothetical protein